MNIDRDDYEDILDYATVIVQGVQDGDCTWSQLGELVDELMTEVSVLRFERDSLDQQLERQRGVMTAMAYTAAGPGRH